MRTGTHDTITLTVSDAVAIKNQVSLIKAVSANVDDPVQVVYGNQNWHTSYRGVAPEYFDVKRSYVRSGLRILAGRRGSRRRLVRAGAHRESERSELLRASA